MKVSDMMNKAVQTCGSDDNLQRAAQLMWENDCGALPVVDSDSRVVGMITDRDVCMAAYTRGQPLWQIPVSTAMAKRVHSVAASDRLAEAEALMSKVRVRRVPVLDGDGRLTGILSINDLARQAHHPNGQRSNGLSGDSVVKTLAAICEPHGVKAAKVRQRAAIVGFLADAEVAKVSRAEGACLVEGDEYVDLDDIDSGVRQVHTTSRELASALPRSAVSDATWAKIVRAVAS